MGDNDKDLAEIARTTTEDFYQLLGVSFECTESELKSAYRKTSLKYHPDKNPDNPAAADKFILVGWARDILRDPKLKEDYDRQRMRKKERALQNELLDSKRRQMKEDLERREREGAGSKRKRAEGMNEQEKLELRIRQLAEDGKRRRKEAQEKKDREAQEEEASFMEPSPEPEPNFKPSVPGQTAEIDRTIKVRFVRDGDVAAWDKAKLKDMFSRFAKQGKIDSIVMGKDKKVRLSGDKHRKLIATVFIVFTRMDEAHDAVVDGKQIFPTLASVSWASKEPEIKSPMNGETSSAPSTPLSTPNKAFRASFTGGMGKGFGTPGTPSFSFSPSTPSLEEVTMMRLKQAEKRRLEEEIRQQEAAEEAAAA